MEKFSKILKELRIEKCLSIKQLSIATKIGSSSICRWENCQSDICASQLIILADYFGVTTDYLLGREE